MIPQQLRIGMLLSVFFASAMNGLCGDEPAKVEAQSPVVNMEPYTVRDTRVLPPKESWRYVLVSGIEITRGKNVVAVPGFEVLSNYSEKNTRLFVSEIQLRQFAGAYLWPMLVKLQPRQAVVVILDRTAQAALAPADRDAVSFEGDSISRSETGSADFSSQSFSSGQWLVEADPFGTPATPPGGEPQESFSAGVGTMTSPISDFSAPRRALPPGYVILNTREDLVAATVRGDAPMAAAAVPSEEQLAANFSAWLAVSNLHNLPGGVPHWFQQALHWLIEMTDVTSTRLTFAGSVLNESEKYYAPLKNVFEKAGGLTEDETRTAATFTHFGLFGDGGKHAKAFMAFTTRLTHEPFSEAMVKEVFGKSLHALEMEVQSYGRSFAAYTSVETRGEIPDMIPFEVREATQSQVARLKAESLMAAGKPDRGLEELRIAYLRGEREPDMLTLLAELEERIGSVERAEKIVKGLVGNGTPPRRLPLVEAKLRFRAATAGLAAGDKIPTAETRAIFGLLTPALRAGQNSEQLWALISEVVLRSAGKPHPSVGDLLARAATRYPDNTRIHAAAELTRQKNS
jgi:hypothetical protein